VVAELGLPPGGAAPTGGFKVAYHDACSLQHGQGIRQPPRDLLRGAGFDVVDTPEAHLCCGSAGTYNVLKPENGAALGRRKAENVLATGAQAVASGNIGCMEQIAQYSGLPNVHTVELLDWATGGPRPRALEG